MDVTDELAKKARLLLEALERAPFANCTKSEIRRELAGALKRTCTAEAVLRRTGETLEAVRQRLARAGVRPEGKPWGSGTLLVAVLSDGSEAMQPGERVVVIGEAHPGEDVEVVGETGRCAHVTPEQFVLDSTPDTRVGTPAPNTAARQVSELVKMLRPYGSGEEGDSDVVARVRRLLGELDANRYASAKLLDCEDVLKRAGHQVDGGVALGVAALAESLHTVKNERNRLKEQLVVQTRFGEEVCLRLRDMAHAWHHNRVRGEHPADAEWVSCIDVVCLLNKHALSGKVLDACSAAACVEALKDVLDCESDCTMQGVVDAARKLVETHRTSVKDCERLKGQLADVARRGTPERVEVLEDRCAHALWVVEELQSRNASKASPDLSFIIYTALARVHAILSGQTGIDTPTAPNGLDCAGSGRPPLGTYAPGPHVLRCPVGCGYSWSAVIGAADALPSTPLHVPGKDE